MFAIVLYYFYFINTLKKVRPRWHATCCQFSCQVTEATQHFIQIIPDNLPSEHKKRRSDFTRKRHLPFNKLVTLTLSLAASGTNQGIDPKAGLFFKNARRSGLWPDTPTVHRSTISKGRAKIPWAVFQNILSDAVKVAYDLWPQDDSRYLWHGMSVYATDGSPYNLPPTDEIRSHFDPQSGLQNKGKGHYPQCLVSTVYDVFRRLPIARTVVNCNGCEREQITQLLPSLAPQSVWMFDRGYPGYGTITELTEHYDGYFLFRAPATSTFKVVQNFIKSGKDEDIIWISPSHDFKRKVSLTQRKKLQPIKLRVIRLQSPDGTLSVLLTNLFGKHKYSRDEIIQLYFRRWEIENYYRDEKITLQIEKFHSKTVNGILQELYAAMIMSVITRTFMALSSQWFYCGQHELQFKNAILTLASDAALLAADNPQEAVKIFKEIVHEMARVKYYRPKKPRPSQPRVNKGPINKWNRSKIKKMAACA